MIYFDPFSLRTLSFTAFQGNGVPGTTDSNGQLDTTKKLVIQNLVPAATILLKHTFLEHFFFPVLCSE